MAGRGWLLALPLAAVGCAPIVEVETPWGIGYRSTKDVEIRVEIHNDPGSGELRHAVVEIRGEASGVVHAEAERLRMLSEGIAAGIIKGTVEGVTP